MPWEHVAANVHGPLYAVLLHYWGGLAGDSEWAMRFPSAVFGTATVPALAWMSGRWLGRDTIVPAAWLAAGSPFLIWYSQEARNYVLLFLCVTLAAGAILGLRRRLNAGGLVGFLAAAIAGVLSNLSFLLLAPLYLWWWLTASERRGRRLLILGLAAGVLVAALLPWFPQLRESWDWKRLHPARRVETEALRNGPAISLAAYPFTFHAFAVGYTLGPSIREMRTRGAARAVAHHVPELAWTGVLFLLLGALAVRAAVRRKAALAAVFAIVLPTLFVSYGALQNFKVYHPRYVAVSFPFLLALLAAGLADLKPRARALLAGALALTWLVSLQHHFFVPGYGKEDMRTAAAWMKARLRPGDRILAAGADEVIIYYYRGPLNIGRFWLGWTATPGKMVARLDDARRGADAVWVVWSRGEDLDPEGRFLGYLRKDFPAADHFATEGVEIWRLPGKAGP